MAERAPGMNIRQMRYILEIAKAGSVTTAANNLLISQPSLSSLLANVERELGTQLFDRGTTPIILTYAGEKYIAAANKILGTYHELQQEIDDMRDDLSGRLNVGCSPQLSPFFIPSIVPVMLERYPGAQINFTEESSKALEVMLLNGALDILICGGYISHPSFERIILLEEDLILLAPLDRVVPIVDGQRGGQKFPCANLRELSGEPFVLMKKTQQMRQMQDRALTENGCAPKIILETGNWQTSVRLVVTGMAYTLLPYVKTETPIYTTRLFCLERTRSRHTCLFYRKNSYYSKLLDAFIQTVKSIIAA
jgi:DNA-binding transcriptional LysR family regulator